MGPVTAWGPVQGGSCVGRKVHLKGLLPGFPPKFGRSKAGLHSTTHEQIKFLTISWFYLTGTWVREHSHRWSLFWLDYQSYSYANVMWGNCETWDTGGLYNRSKTNPPFSFEKRPTNLQDKKKRSHFWKKYFIIYEKYILQNVSEIWHGWVVHH